MNHHGCVPAASVRTEQNFLRSSVSLWLYLGTYVTKRMHREWCHWTGWRGIRWNYWLRLWWIHWKEPTFWFQQWWCSRLSWVGQIDDKILDKAMVLFGSGHWCETAMLRIRWWKVRGMPITITITVRDHKHCFICLSIGKKSCLISTMVSPDDLEEVAFTVRPQVTTLPQRPCTIYQEISFRNPISVWHTHTHTHTHSLFHIHVRVLLY